MSVPNRQSAGPNWELIILLLVAGTFVVAALWLTGSVEETRGVIEALVVLLVVLGAARVPREGRDRRDPPEDT